MKILYDHQIFSWQRWGGISRYFYEIINRLSVTNDISLYAGLYINEYGIEHIKGLQRFTGFKRPNIKHTNRIFNKLDEFKLRFFYDTSDIDIYHPTYYKDFCLNNGKLIVSVYDMIHELYGNEFGNDPTIQRKANIIRKADRVIAISESTKNDLVRILGINPNKVDVIYLANSLNAEVDDNRVENSPYILLVGHGAGYKNFPMFIEAYAHSKASKDFNCVVFGGPRFNPTELAQMHKLGLDNKVKYYAGNDEMLANLYKNAELFVYPSQYEGFGLPPLEAMHYGTPVLSSNTSSMPEVIGDAGAYFNPNDVESMTYELDAVLGNSILLNKLSYLGIEREKLFSWDRCACEHLETYRRAMDGE